MPERLVHLVGSLPFEEDEEAAMRRALDLLGPRLRSLPDGDLGHRNHHRPFADVLTRVPAHELRHHLDFGLVESFTFSYAIFQRLRHEYGRPDLAFQFGVPGALTLALFNLGPLHGLHLRSILEDQLLEECNRIRTLADDVVFQIEVPVELGAVLNTPRALQRLVARTTSQWITRFVGRLLPETRVGIHLCLGGLHSRPFSIDVIDQLVAFSLQLMRTWPPRRSLEYFHVPLTRGDQPPSQDFELYRPLRRLRVGQGTRVIAGFVHEDLDDDAHRKVLAFIEQQLLHTVDVSSACGLGRHSPAVAEVLMRRTARLAGLFQPALRIAATG
jgi:hypothetical protein